MPFPQDAQMYRTALINQVPSTIAGGDMTLLQLTLPARIFRDIGDTVVVLGNAVLAANANSKTTTLKLAVPAGDTVIAGRTATDNAGTRFMQAWIYRISATAIQTAGLCTTLATATSIVTDNATLTVDFTLPLILKLNAQAATTDGDVTSRLLKFYYIPVNSNFQ